MGRDQPDDSPCGNIWEGRTPGLPPNHAQTARLRDTAGSQKSPRPILNFILLDKLFLWRKILFLERISQQSPAPAASPGRADAILMVLVWRRAKSTALAMNSTNFWPEEGACASFCRLGMGNSDKSISCVHGSSQQQS